MTTDIRHRRVAELLLRNLREVADPEPAVPSWRNANWQYQPSATHGDSTAFAARQRERLRRAQP